MKLRLSHDRRSLRLHSYDYSQPGAYFITICTYENKNLPGNIFDGEIKLWNCILRKPQGGDYFQLSGMLYSVPVFRFLTGSGSRDPNKASFGISK